MSDPAVSGPGSGGPRQRILFLPGAGGDGCIWRAAASRLPPDWDVTVLDWPGAGAQPHDPAVQGFDSLVGLALEALAEPAVVVAHSMGGLVALALAAAHPDKVRRLVLVATSAGLDMAAHGAEDWRTQYRLEYPGAADWVTAPVPDQRELVQRARVPVLLLWGDADPISPVAVGETLCSLLADARLEVIAGATHSLPGSHAGAVADLILDFVGPAPGGLTLDVLAGEYAIWRLAADAPLPELPGLGDPRGGEFLSITRTAEELSVVAPEHAVPAGAAAVRGWRGLRVAGPLDFALTGIAAALTAPLARDGIAVFLVSTYDTDYLFVRGDTLAAAVSSLERAGHRVRIEAPHQSRWRSRE